MKVSLLPIITLLSILDDKYVSGQSMNTTNTTDPGDEASEIPDGQPTLNPEPPTMAPVESTTPAPVPSPCFTDLNEIFGLEQMADPNVVRTYVLCTNTVFTLGRPNADGTAVVGGSVPIIPRPNAHYKCGEDGLSSNECVLEGGDAAVQASGGGNLLGVVFEGITFRAQFFAGAFFSRPGEFHFIDCIFREQRNLGAVLSFWPIEANRNLQGQEDDIYAKMLNNAIQTFGIDPIEEEADKEKHRLLQDQNLILNFLNVYFEDNSLAPQPEAFGASYRPGIVTAEKVQTIMNFDGCLFQFNDYGDTTKATLSWGISAVGPLNITDTCFENSDFITSPVLIFGQTAVLNNNFGSDNNVQGECEFVADYGTAALTSGLPLNQLENVTCIDYDATSCAYDFNTPAPVDPGMPTIEPAPVDPGMPTETLPPVAPTRAPRRTSAPTMLEEDTPAPEPTPAPGPSTPESSALADYSFFGGILMSTMVGMALV